MSRQGNRYSARNNAGKTTTESSANQTSKDVEISIARTLSCNRRRLLPDNLTVGRICACLGCSTPSGISRRNSAMSQRYPGQARRYRPANRDFLSARCSIGSAYCFPRYSLHRHYQCARRYAGASQVQTTNCNGDDETKYNMYGCRRSATEYDFCRAAHARGDQAVLAR